MQRGSSILDLMNNGVVTVQRSTLLWSGMWTGGPKCAQHDTGTWCHGMVQYPCGR